MNKLLRIALAFSFISLKTIPVFASDGFDSCNQLLTLGLYNISQSSNATDAHSMAKSTFCSADYNKIEKGSSQAANIEASYGLFSGGAGGSATSSEITIKQSQVCTSGFNSSSYSNQAADLSRTIYQGSLDAWNRCQSMANKGINFDIMTDPSLQGVTVTLSQPQGFTSTFNGLTQMGTGKSTCKTTIPAQEGSRIGKSITVDEKTSFGFDSSGKLTIICKREMRTDKNGNSFADALTLVFNTSAGAYQVPLAGIGRLSDISVDEATTQIKAAVQENIKRQINELQIALKQQAIDLSKKIDSTKSWYGVVKISELQKIHSGCIGTDYTNQLSPCISAAQYWCQKQEKGNLGIIQQWHKEELSVGCLF